MKWTQFIRICAAGALAAACGQVFAPAGPTTEDVWAQLPRVMSRAALLDTSVSSCSEGEMNGAQVMVCNVCFVAVGVRGANDPFRGDRSGLIVRQSSLSAAFRRAVSYDQPNIQPKGGAAGVWIIQPETINESDTVASSAVLPVELMSRAGYQPQTGFSAMMSANAGNALPDEVRGRFASDADLAQQTRALVNGCSGEVRRAPTASRSAELPTAEVSNEQPASTAPEGQDQTAVPPPAPTAADLEAARQRGAAAAAEAAGN